ARSPPGPTTSPGHGGLRARAGRSSGSRAPAGRAGARGRTGTARGGAGSLTGPPSGESAAPTAGPAAPGRPPPAVATAANVKALRPGMPESPPYAFPTYHQPDQARRRARGMGPSSGLG